MESKCLPQSLSVFGTIVIESVWPLVVEAENFIKVLKKNAYSDF